MEMIGGKAGHVSSVRLRLSGGLLGLAALVSGLWLAEPAGAASPEAALSGNSAENIRRLDIMLMVTGLRCRTTPDNFQPDYARFTKNQLPVLNGAASTLRADLARRYGNAGAAKALDKLSVTMANTYGQGHPWLDCAELKTVTRNLADVRGADALADAARQLLAPSGNPRLAFAGR